MRHQLPIPLPDPELWRRAFIAGRVALAFDAPVPDNGVGGGGLVAPARLEPGCCPEPAPFVPSDDPDDRPYLWDLDDCP